MDIVLLAAGSLWFAVYTVWQMLGLALLAFAIGILIFNGPARKRVWRTRVEHGWVGLGMVVLLICSSSFTLIFFFICDADNGYGIAYRHFERFITEVLYY